MKRLSGILNNVFWLYKPYIKHAKLLVFFSVIFSVFVMPLSRVIAVYFPELVMNSLNQRSSFSTTLCLVLLISLIQLAIPMFEDFFNICIRDKYQAKIDMLVKREVYTKAQQTDYKFIDSPEFYDDYKWAIDEYSSKCKESFSLFETLLSTASVIISLLVAALSAVPWAIIFALISMAFRTYGYLNINHLEISRQQENIIHDRKRDYVHRLFYSRQYAADLKSTRLSDLLLRDYDTASLNKINIIQKYARKILLWAFRCDMVYRTSMVLTIISITYSIHCGRISDIGAYVTLMLAVDNLDTYLYELFEVIKQASNLDLHTVRIRKFFDRKSNIETSSGTVTPASGPFDIEMRFVSFSYLSSNFQINNFNLKIHNGEKIAIVGENGAGKSTLLKLLLRLYDVESGCIFINGIPIKDYSLPDLRSRIGVAFQNTHVYAHSFKENIELYHPITKANLNEISDEFNFHEIFSKTSASFDSEVTREFRTMELSFPVEKYKK